MVNFPNNEALKGSICDGIMIMRSTDNINFEKVVEIFGVCGSISEAISYEFIDQEPITGDSSFYKLDPGINGELSVKSIFIIGLKENQSLVSPNPFSSASKLYYNLNDVNSQLIVFDQRGRQLFNSEVSQYPFDLNFAHETKGIFYYLIVTDNKTESGRFVLE